MVAGGVVLVYPQPVRHYFPQTITRSTLVSYLPASTIKIAL